MKDKNGVEIKEGDEVIVKYKVASLLPSKGETPDRIRIHKDNHIDVIAPEHVEVQPRAEKGLPPGMAAAMKD